MSASIPAARRGDPCRATTRRPWRASTATSRSWDGRPRQIDRASWRELSARERHLLYGYGYLIAEGIGIEGLREFDSDEIEYRRAAIFLVDGLVPPQSLAILTPLRHGLTGRDATSPNHLSDEKTMRPILSTHALAAIAGFSICLAGVVTMSMSQQAASPVEALPERDVYYPGSESLAPDEMRVVCLGSGMPNARPKQAAACWLVELGNGDKFLFDIGSGSAERISAMKIPYDYLDKVFIGHLHSDHFGDLSDLWIGGMIGNRQRPLRVWGPSGARPETGTKYACEHMQKMFQWDLDSRLGNVNTQGTRLEVNEFDYKAVNQIIYDENDVQIRTIPAIHAIDGPVSFILEWNDLKFSFSSDTFPNKWWIEHTKDSDVAVHECFAPPSVLIDKQKWPPADALNVGTQVHTSPAQFGKVMSEIKPRLAVGYHFFNDFDTLPIVDQMVRKTYDGPLALASDYMVFNVTKDEIRVRMAAIDEDIWPLPSVTEKLPADPSQKIGFSDFITEGRVPYSDVVEKIYADINKRYGSNVEPPK